MKPLPPETLRGLSLRGLFPAPKRVHPDCTAVWHKGASQSSKDAPQEGTCGVPSVRRGSVRHRRRGANGTEAQAALSPGLAGAVGSRSRALPCVMPGRWGLEPPQGSLEALLQGAELPRDGASCPSCQTWLRHFTL